MASVVYTRGVDTVLGGNAGGGTFAVTNPSAAPVYIVYVVGGVRAGFAKVQAATQKLVTYPAGATLVVMAGATATVTVV